MKSFKINKKGISLIVLILTIIVMIILATAIILSLSNSGIIGKANQAKQDSDTASLKEYVNVLQAEYELMSETERGGKTSTEYVNAKLEAEGYKRRLNDDGVLLTEAAVYVIDNNVQIGDEITGYNKYLTVGKISNTDGKENNVGDVNESYHFEIGDNTPNNVTCAGFTTWRYIGINDEGEVMIVPDMTDSTMPEMTLSGLGTFCFGPERINEVCKELYSTSIGSAEGMNLEHVVNILEYTGNRSQYWSINCYDLPEGGSQCTTTAVPIKESLSVNELYSKGLNPFDQSSSELYHEAWYDYEEELPFELADVKIDVSEISSTSTEINAERANLVFFGEVKYWLASRSLDNSDQSYTYFVCDEVLGSKIGVSGFYMADTAPRVTAYIRPVVSLSSGVTLSPVSDGVYAIN